MNAENPCFDCKITINGQTHRAPCCSDIRLVMLYSTYYRDFKGKPNVGDTQPITDEWMGEELMVDINGSCPQLNQTTGECQIYDRRPQACRDLAPGIDLGCSQTPNGRWHNKYVQRHSLDKDLALTKL